MFFHCFEIDNSAGPLTPRRQDIYSAQLVQMVGVSGAPNASRFDILACERCESTSSALAGPRSSEAGSTCSTCCCSIGAGAGALLINLLPRARKNATGGDSLIAAPMSWALPVPGTASISRHVSPRQNRLFTGRSDRNGAARLANELRRNSDRWSRPATARAVQSKDCS
jgi:hypothetical protein